MAKIKEVLLPHEIELLEAEGMDTNKAASLLTLSDLKKIGRHLFSERTLDKPEAVILTSALLILFNRAQQQHIDLWKE
jgi:hypothetical protein